MREEGGLMVWVAVLFLLLGYLLRGGHEADLRRQIQMLSALLDEQDVPKGPVG